MKNKEKYFDAIIKQFPNAGYYCELKRDKILKCGQDCSKTSCDAWIKKSKQWIEEEYIEEPIHLTYDEYVLLKEIVTIIEDHNLIQNYNFFKNSIKNYEKENMND